MIHHLKSLRLTTFIITVGFVLNGSMIPGWWTPAKAVAQTDSQITILDANQRGILLELQVNDFKVEQIHKAGELFSRVQIGTMAQTNLPGLPQVPTEGTLLGVPIPEGLSLQIVETDYQTLIGHRLLPAPQLRSQSDEPDGFAQATFQERFMLDAQRDAKDSVYPHAVAEIGEVGYLRDQAVAQIQFYPVQHNPQRNELRIYHHIRVQLTWNRPPADAVTNVRWHSRPYETLFSELLQNYRWLPQPKVYPTTNTIARSTNIEGGYSTNCVNCRSQSERNRITTQFGIPPIEANQTGSLPALKIYVIEEGLYRLTYLNLLNAGFDPGIHNLHTFKLYNQGVEIPIYVDGEYNGVFDPDDSIYFYGAAIDNDYTTRNVYWLVADGSIGRRMAVQSGLIAGNGAFVHRFLATEHIEEDTVYWQNMPGRNQDRWFWGQRLSPDTEGMDSSRTFSIRVDNIATKGEATVRVELHGYTGLKHHSRIYLNEHEIDDLAWWGQKPFTHVVNVLPQFLRNGENVLRVETVDTGAAVDQILVNWVELDYWDTYTAEDSQLWFRSEIAGIGQFEIAGLSDQNVMLLDITDVRRPTRITNPAVVDQGGRYAVRFEVSTQPGRRYYVTTLSRAKSPAALLLDQPSRWRAATHGADYIIITSQEFYRSALVLAEHRQASGLRVATIIVDDLYDEFTHGLFSPRAIRRFLQYTYENWQTPAPTYVLLFGDANQDYKDNFKTGAVNYVPSYNMDSSLFGEVSSDNWFVAVNGDDQLPDMFIGRLVAQNQAEVMVEKIIQYEQNPAIDGWERNVLHVADIGTKFERIAEDLAAHLPSDYVVSRVYANDYQSSTAGVSATTDIVDRINQGSVLVTYIGHGNFASWGRSQIGFVFGTSNVDALNNGERLPVVVVGNCLNGFFAGAKESPSLAEVLQRRKAGGAIAVWAPSGLGYPDDHAVLLHEFYRAMFADSSQTIGAATTAAKLAIFAGNQHRRELVETYVLFGDPALRLARAPDHQYQARITK